MSNWKGQKEWDKKNIKKVSCNIPLHEYIMFEEYIKQNNTNKSKVLHDYIKKCISTLTEPSEPEAQPQTAAETETTNQTPINTDI